MGDFPLLKISHPPFKSAQVLIKGGFKAYTAAFLQEKGMHLFKRCSYSSCQNIGNRHCFLVGGWRPPPPPFFEKSCMKPCMSSAWLLCTIEPQTKGSDEQEDSCMCLESRHMHVALAELIAYIEDAHVDCEVGSNILADVDHLCYSRYSCCKHCLHIEHPSQAVGAKQNQCQIHW